MKIRKIKGMLKDSRRIVLESTGKIVSWNDLNLDLLSGIPYGSTIEVSIMFDEEEFISGKDGFVWATYDHRQAQIIRDALLSLKMDAGITQKQSAGQTVYLLKITIANDIREAIDFIWKGKSGLRLEPDWNYSEGEKNKSFEQWLNEQ